MLRRIRRGCRIAGAIVWPRSLKAIFAERRSAQHSAPRALGRPSPPSPYFIRVLNTNRGLDPGSGQRDIA